MTVNITNITFLHKILHHEYYMFTLKNVQIHTKIFKGVQKTLKTPQKHLKMHKNTQILGWQLSFVTSIKNRFLLQKT
jgi:hypothetical protein